MAINTERYILNFQIAFQAILANKMRSMLTALGIIFGVAAVIAMLAIGNGARQEILEQIKLVGVNNIVISPLREQKEEQVQDKSNAASESGKKKFTPGLTLKDVESIKEVVPGVKIISPEVVIETDFLRNGLSRSGKLVGVEPAYFDITNFKIENGSIFNKKQLEYGEQVCIIGSKIKAKFFSNEDPIGKFIKCGQLWLKVIGVMEDKAVSDNSISKLGIRDYNMDIYTPLRTVIVRYKNRSLITKASLASGNMGGDGDQQSTEKPKENYNQLDRVVVQVENTEELIPTSEVISRLMERRHYSVVDYEITMPELLLKQEQRTKDIFNIVLFAIACISLLVGGIGIMNIMLASVLERIKEIGLRLSIGAKKKDIVLQFVMESMLISFSGGIAGVLLGLIIAILISAILDIKTIVSIWSIFISFGVSLAVGLIFGIAPARRASEQDPIVCLRYE